MKTISIRFNDHLANWITGNCQKDRITISEFIRDLLYGKMKHGQVDINVFKINRTSKHRGSQNYRTELGYIIFTAKLLENFILATQEQGDELRNVAFAEAKDLLSQFNLSNKNKEQRFCFTVEEIIYSWLASEASRLQVLPSQLIRAIVEDVYLEDRIVVNHQVSELQKNSMEHQIMTCKLLELLISRTISNGGDIVEKARYNANDTISKLYKPNKSLVTS